MNKEILIADGVRVVQYEPSGTFHVEVFCRGLARHGWNWVMYNIFDDELEAIEWAKDPANVI